MNWFSPVARAENMGRVENNGVYPPVPDRRQNHFFSGKFAGHVVDPIRRIASFALLSQPGVPETPGRETGSVDEPASPGFNSRLDHVLCSIDIDPVLRRIFSRPVVGAGRNVEDSIQAFGHGLHHGLGISKVSEVNGDRDPLDIFQRGRRTDQNMDPPTLPVEFPNQV